jgi:hypothetical protein
MHHASPAKGSSMKVRPKPEPGPKTEDVEHPFARLARIESDPLLHFAAAIQALGPIPQGERNQSIDYLLVAAHAYILRQAVEARRQSPSEQLQAHKRIAAAAAQLLKALGIDDPVSLASGWPPLPPPGSSKHKFRAYFKRTAGPLPPMAALQVRPASRARVRGRGGRRRGDELTDPVSER